MQPSPRALQGKRRRCCLPEGHYFLCQSVYGLCHQEKVYASLFIRCFIRFVGRELCSQQWFTVCCFIVGTCESNVLVIGSGKLPICLAILLHVYQDETKVDTSFLVGRGSSGGMRLPFAKWTSIYCSLTVLKKRHRCSGMSLLEFDSLMSVSCTQVLMWKMFDNSFWICVTSVWITRNVVSSCSFIGCHSSGNWRVTNGTR